MQNIVLIGPQGSGKGTQAIKLIEQFGLYHIEAGALIRSRAKEHDEKAEILDHLANKKGALLPDGVVLDMIYDELFDHISESGYLFDGFPRSVKQYQALTELLDQRHQRITAVVYLEITDEEAVKRLEARRSCAQCRTGYSLLLEPERERCDCGGELVRRVDDTPEAIRHRLSLYHETTQPILDLAESDGVLVKVDGERPIDEISQEILSKLFHTPGV